MFSCKVPKQGSPARLSCRVLQHANRVPRGASKVFKYFSSYLCSGIICHILLSSQATQKVLLTINNALALRRIHGPVVLSLQNGNSFLSPSYIFKYIFKPGLVFCQLCSEIGATVCSGQQSTHRQLQVRQNSDGVIRLVRSNQIGDTGYGL